MLMRKRESAEVTYISSLNHRTIGVSILPFFDWRYTIVTASSLGGTHRISTHRSETVQYTGAWRMSGSHLIPTYVGTQVGLDSGGILDGF